MKRNRRGFCFYHLRLRSEFLLVTVSITHSFWSTRRMLNNRHTWELDPKGCRPKSKGLGGATQKRRIDSFQSQQGAFCGGGNRKCRFFFKNKYD
jgi:hypothetical protein